MDQHPDTEPQDRSGALPPPGLGARLRRAREAKGLELDRAASGLHLPASILEALERDDYGSLPSTYVQGYLRTYAKTLGLAPDVVVAEYRHTLPVEAPPVAPEETPSPEQMGRRTPRRGLYGLFGVLALLLAFAGWWVRREPHLRPAPAPTLTRSAPATSPAASPPGPASAPARVVPPSVPPVPSIPSVPGPQPTTQLPQGGAAIRAPAVSAATPPRTQPRTQVSTPAAAGPDQLVIRCVEDSWVEVRDARGRRLVYDLLHAGAVRRLNGVAPFHIVLGNAAGVRLALDGHDVTLPPRRIGQVEHFTVPAAVPSPPRPNTRR
ncbi:MAG: hypothetical protein B7Z66_05615 [Chromatiales bacterium 21-64-14]|nr:MAG: hypothetical protein B7Z66_05615 [Chromatiales bacterium 21-64-14]HQU15031.1 DUF4115 domain-containing protein [Gammaproteobacteria bacterium]